MPHRLHCKPSHTPSVNYPAKYPSAHWTIALLLWSHYPDYPMRLHMMTSWFWNMLFERANMQITICVHNASQITMICPIPNIYQYAQNNKNGVLYTSQIRPSIEFAHLLPNQHLSKPTSHHMPLELFTRVTQLSHLYIQPTLKSASLHMSLQFIIRVNQPFLFVHLAYIRFSKSPYAASTL
jgi:hypothetical protein